MADLISIDSDRFWRHVDKTEDCWLWTASTTHNGYGQFNDSTTMVRADRARREEAA
jgi:hypothetical protein